MQVISSTTNPIIKMIHSNGNSRIEGFKGVAKITM